MTQALEKLEARWRIFAAGAIIAVAVWVAYANSLGVPFVYDDLKSIVDNPTIRHLWPPWESLSWPRGNGLTVEGRPILNLSLALNYAISRDDVWSYHAFNVLIHLFAGLCLFGIVRRTLASGRASGLRRGGANSPATALGLAVALLWTVHPLQTEAVTYTVQRSESLMGLFYLLTLYCFIRGVEDGEKATGGVSWPWFALSWLACLFGMATKEVMVSVPVMVFLYDRTFVAGSFREAWRRHRRLYVGLAATWVLLAYLVLRVGGNRGGSAGFDVGVDWWAYWLTQFQAIVHYLGLAIWPHPLVFDYGTFWVKHAAQVVPFACIVALLVAFTAVALWRWPAWGFLGAWFFAILAPTSLVPGTTQMIVEHRMYLALAPVMMAVVGGAYGMLKRIRRNPRLRCVPAAFLLHSWVVLLAVAAAALCGLTVQRNADYASAVSLWSDTVAKCPDNERAHLHLGYELAKIPDRLPEAVAQYQAVLRIDPDLAEAHVNLANTLATIPGRMPEAITHYEEALRINPDLAEAHYNLANALATTHGRQSEAVAQYEAALRINPNYAEAQVNLANTLVTITGRIPEAVAHYEEALRLNPSDVGARYNLANALATIPGRMPAAVAQYEEALRLDPNLAEAEVNLANALTTLPGRLAEAVPHYETALRLRPDLAVAEMNLGSVLFALGRLAEADFHCTAALRLDPGLEDARETLTRVRAAERARGSGG